MVKKPLSHLIIDTEGKSPAFQAFEMVLRTAWEARMEGWNGQGPLPGLTMGPTKVQEEMSKPKPPKFRSRPYDGAIDHLLKNKDNVETAPASNPTGPDGQAATNEKAVDGNQSETTPVVSPNGPDGQAVINKKTVEGLPKSCAGDQFGRKAHTTT
jgi:hypothetical protein